MDRRLKRVFVIVLDSMGMGAMADAARFGDEGADTLGHISQTVEHFYIPNLASLGLANLKSLKQVQPQEHPLGYYAALNEKSNGKDTMTGHWEMMGIETKKPFITFTEHGFPPELIAELEKRCGRKIIGNRAESGTKILEELGEQEIREGKLIVYTSADSVLQICGNEETMGLETLYHYCEIARELTMRDEWRVGRVIARPYVGKKKGEFVRTSNRRDYALKPTGPTALNALQEAGYDVLAVGKIHDIFDGYGITKSLHSTSSVHGMDQTIALAQSDFCGLCFTNLVDFDALWGHRRNPIGYGEEIERFDKKLGELMPLLKKEDLLMITADHGNDPTYKGTDHTREQVPLLLYSPSDQGSGSLPTQDTFAVIGATIADNFGVQMPAEYLEKFELPLGCLQTKEGLSAAAQDLALSAAKEQVKYLEVRFAPAFSMEQGLSVREILERVRDGLKKAEEKADILTGMIVCTMRNLETEKNIAMLKEAREFLGNGVVACDLAGDEKAYPTAAFADVFATAKKYGMPYTIHAGECGSREEIRTAIELGTSRIGHGIAMSGDEELKKEVAEKKIGVELCPTSNLQTKAVTDFTDYPFREFYDAGILLSINTDNRTVSDTSCTDEYMRLAEAGMFQEPMCEKIYMASLHSAFADDDTKQVLWKKWMSMFDL